MKLVMNFNKILENLDYVSTVVEDKLLDESLRNIIFKLTETGVSLIGYSSISICKTHLQQGDFEVSFNEGDLENGVAYMQLKSKELSNFLGTFKTLKTTKPVAVEFETFRNKVRLTVVEEFLNSEEGEAPKTQKSVWMFDNLEVKPNVLKEIGVEVGEGTSVSSLDILLCVNSLSPLVSDEGGNSLPSRLNFAEDYVVAVPGTFASLFRNELPEAFKGITLGYSALNFLRKILMSNEVVTISRSEIYLTISTGTSDAFLRYQTKIPNTELYLRNYKKDHAVVVDRLYLRDVLKRLSIVNDNALIEVDTANNVLKLKNSKFSQDVPLLAQKGMEGLPSVSFKLATAIFNKAIIGDDSVFAPEGGEVRMYITPLSPSGYVICFSDATDLWFSAVQVR